MPLSVRSIRPFNKVEILNKLQLAGVMARNLLTFIMQILKQAIHIAGWYMLSAGVLLMEYTSQILD